MLPTSAAIPRAQILQRHIHHRLQGFSEHEPTRPLRHLLELADAVLADWAHNHGILELFCSLVEAHLSDILALQGGLLLRWLLLLAQRYHCALEGALVHLSGRSVFKSGRAQVPSLLKDIAVCVLRGKIPVVGSIVETRIN